MFEILKRRYFNAAKHERALGVIALVLLIVFAIVGAAWTPSQFVPSPVPSLTPSLKNPIDYLTPPLPQVNNTTKINVTKPTATPTATPTPKPPSPAGPQPIRIAVAGDVRLITMANLDTFKAMGVDEVHIVVPDAGTYTTMLNAIRARGMVPVYDGEVPFWLNRGFSSAPYNADEMAQLRAIFSAGWHDFASEGLFAGQVEQITSIGFRYYNYGCDQGLCLYACSNSYYAHPIDSHYANYEEFYTASLASITLQSIKTQATYTPLHNGILFGLWQNDVINNGPTYITQFNGQGAKITTALFWGGLNMNPLTYIGEGAVYHQAFHNVQDVKVAQ